MRFDRLLTLIIVVGSNHMYSLERLDVYGLLK